MLARREYGIQRFHFLPINLEREPVKRKPAARAEAIINAAAIAARRRKDEILQPRKYARDDTYEAEPSAFMVCRFKRCQLHVPRNHPR